MREMYLVPRRSLRFKCVFNYTNSINKRICGRACSKKVPDTLIYLPSSIILAYVPAIFPVLLSSLNRVLELAQSQIKGIKSHVNS